MTTDNQTTELLPCPLREMISDDELQRVFAGTNFGKSRTPRDIVAETVLKIGGGYHSGHTALVCCQELGLVGRNKMDPRLTRKGQKYMFQAWYYTRTPAAAMPEQVDDEKYHQLCRQCWTALGITEYTGKHIAEHITELREQIATLSQPQPVTDADKAAASDIPTTLDWFNGLVSDLQASGKIGRADYPNIREVRAAISGLKDESKLVEALEKALVHLKGRFRDMGKSHEAAIKQFEQALAEHEAEAGR